MFDTGCGLGRGRPGLQSYGPFSLSWRFSTPSQLEQCKPSSRWSDCSMFLYSGSWFKLPSSDPLLKPFFQVLPPALCPIEAQPAATPLKETSALLSNLFSGKRRCKVKEVEHMLAFGHFFAILLLQRNCFQRCSIVWCMTFGTIVRLVRVFFISFLIEQLYMQDWS